MTAYMAWADDVMLTGADQLSDAELIAPREALFKTSLVLLTTHLLFRKFSMRITSVDHGAEKLWFLRVSYCS